MLFSPFVFGWILEHKLEHADPINCYFAAQIEELLIGVSELN
jgi:hypothetical protein